ncbi:hypothetical protein QTP86_006798 [Hemibagrus guttatus]|nr:hypothetical protein QTP86_006798 [Hemibagrus guttatus]
MVQHEQPGAQLPKAVEMIVDFRKDPAPRPPVILCDSPVTSVESFCFLGTTITKELKWEQNIRSLTKKTQQRMYFLRQLKKFLLPVKMLVNFYTAIIESSSHPPSQSGLLQLQPGARPNCSVSSTQLRSLLGAIHRIAFGCSLFRVATADQLVRTTTRQMFYAGCPS